ncbi:MAG: non-ribosomal peptide synthetase, partial [Spirochaetaceae bacterium]|nr:non-ribosomal peptide synthetase [Spirochaetaceae bacterium]
SPGYWKKPELTNDKFHMNTIYDTSPIYATGDLVVEAEDGEIHFIGRMDNQLKIRGFRIEAGEIESVLRDIPSIEDAVVLAKKDKFNNSILVAYYIASDPTLDISSAKSVLKKKLPDYMIPSFFIQMEDFPRSPNMKIDHNSFPEYREIRNKKVEEHLSDLQLTLKNIWEDILGVSDFRIDDSFFDLGGHSLLITVLKKQTDRVLNMDIPILRFYQYPTIKSMSDNFETNNNNTNQLKNTKNLFKRKRAGSNCGR